MIELRILAPLPMLLGLSDSTSEMNIQLPYHTPNTIETVISALAGNYTGFEQLLREQPEIITGLIISVNGKLIFRKEEYKEPLRDASKILLLMPYFGG